MQKLIHTIWLCCVAFIGMVALVSSGFLLYAVVALSITVFQPGQQPSDASSLAWPFILVGLFLLSLTVPAVILSFLYLKHQIKPRTAAIEPTVTTDTQALSPTLPVDPKS